MMKKIRNIFLFLVLALFSASETLAYDQVFPSVKLRYGFSYTFNDSFKNTGNIDLKLAGYKVVFTEGGDFNGASNPVFSPTNAVKQDKVFSPGESKMILSSSPVYKINYHPAVRKSNNIEIVYTTSDYQRSGNQWINKTEHTEYQPYTITWCGDGIVDNYIDEYANVPISETCDPGDTTNQEGWGDNGGTCSNTCQPVHNPAPAVCTDIDVKPITGEAPVTSNFTCTGENASSYKMIITQGNTTLATIPRKNGSYVFENQGTYKIQCYVNDTITSPACGQTVTVDPAQPDVYDLALRKTLSSSTPGPFQKGDTVTFDIRVFNQGDIASGTVEITDYIPTGLTLNDAAWTQSGDKAVRTIDSIAKGGSHNVSISFTINDDAPSTIKNYAEISSDNGIDCDSTTDNTNGNGTGESGGLVDDAIGDGCNDGGDEDDHDVAVITVGSTNVVLIKALSDGQDTKVSVGDTVKFDITVTNKGSITATNLIVEDHFPVGLTLNDSRWTLVSGQTRVARSNTQFDLAVNASKTLEIIFTVNDQFSGTQYNNAIVCDDDENGNDDGCDTPEPPSCDDEDESDDTEGCEPITEEDQLDLIKSLAPGQSSTVNVGDTVNYIIKVRNTGDTTITNQKVEDHFPAGLTLNHADWNLVSGQTRVARYKDVIASIAPNQVIELPISFTVNSGVTGSLRNLAVVCDSGDEVCEPETPPTCDDTDEEGNPEGCEEVEVTSNPSIKIDKTDANPDLDQDSVGGNDTQKVNKGQKAVFKIRVTNDGTENLDTIVLSDARAPNCAGSVTLPGTYPSTWSNFATGGSGDKTDAVLEPNEWFEYTCEKSDTQSGYTNTAGVTAQGEDSDESVNDTDTSVVLVPSSGGGGSGGSTYKCNDIVRNNSNTVSCYGNSKVRSMYVICDGVDSAVKTATKDSNGRRTANFSCASQNVECKVYSSEVSSIGGYAWRTSSACKLDTPISCGNGIVEAGEQCDAGLDEDGNLLPFPTSVCNAPGTLNECRLKTTPPNPDDVCVAAGNCVLTTPNEGEMIFGPSGKKIIGHNDNLLEKMGVYPVMQNNSDYDLSFDQLCVLNNNTDGSLVGISKCVDIPGDRIYPGEKLYIIEDTSGPKVVNQFASIWDNTAPLYPSFVGDKGEIQVGADYGKSVLTTTIKDNGTRYDNAYFAGKLEVRVAKPAVVTTGGGTSYVKASTTADVAEVTKDVYTESNTNFVGVSATSEADAVSSNVEEIDSTDSDAIQEIEAIQTEIIDVTEVAIDTSTATATLENYNGLSNVFIIAGELKASDLPDLTSLSEARTYIIDGADFIVDEDINSNQNIAFVVKNKNIVIKDNVKYMDGTYIVLGGGMITADESGEQLVVNGSLYGNIKDLVANRYYISDDAGQLSVGTIVSFGSGLFSQPAPLVSQFVGEYLESEKVAR